MRGMRGKNQPPDLDFAASPQQLRYDIQARRAIKEGTVMRFQAQYQPEGTVYTYAAVFVCGVWHLTGRSSGTLTHDQMLSKLTSDAVLNAHVATAFEQVA
ncbi:hypothetical protein [Nesterenkonia cremea]|uniref:Uncharacterized protein n=1 Tax=Nesterenkonia cremea TaxID=1882340 RepID=A0A917ENN6_9MICC|nr:hypothetical protein [Nesterenkonia cremea]GGE63616.1 hypothetical protein GCM10011401_08400 [Nesterenkonia cremea]